MKFVIKLGGSLLFTVSNEYNLNLLQQYQSLFYDLHEKGHQFAVVVGGGKISRIASKTSLALGSSIALADQIGIMASRVNAMVITSMIKEIAFLTIPSSYEDLLKHLSTPNKITITGGLQPGQSTNAVAAVVAETLNADLLINLSNVSQVYTSNPKEDPNAKPIPELTYTEFRKIITQNPQTAGRYDLFDVVGVNILERSNIPLYFANGNTPTHIYEILNGSNPGSVVRHAN